MREITVYDKSDAPLVDIAQWDDNVEVRIKDTAITAQAPVHFCNRTCAEAYVVDGTYSGGTLTAKVPNVLARQPHNVVGYVYVTNTDEKRSVLAFTLQMHRRPKPSDIVFKNEKDYVSVTDALNECRDLAKKAETAKQGAETAQKAASANQTAAQAAQTAAEKAKTAAEAAQTTATQQASAASTSAGNAKQSETAAKAAQTAAESAKTAAETARTGAEMAKTGAESARDEIEDMTVTAETGEPDTEASVEKKGGKGSPFSLHFVIPQGHPGDVTVTTLDGVFAFGVEADGNLYMYYDDQANPPKFEYIKETGELYFVFEEVSA